MVKPNCVSDSTVYSRRKSTQFVEAPLSAIDLVLGVLTQIARKYLFIDITCRAIFYFILVVVLSIVSELISFPNHYYIVQKNNVFNRFGTKLGWFWTCLLIIPFIWITSLLHHGSRRKAFQDLIRLVVATLCWNFCTYTFVKVEKHTGICHGADGTNRNFCKEQGGKWIPGFDISGHTFILLYSMFLIEEEARSFQNWPSSPRQSAKHLPNHYEFINFRTSTKIIQWLFVFLFLLHLFWDIQLVITLLYYHTISHKVLGALFAISSWSLTYRLWYKMAFPFSPIRRHIKNFN